MKTLSILIVLLALIFSSCSSSLNKEEQEVLSCLEHMFDAMHHKDIPRLKEILIENGQYHAINLNSGKITCKSFNDFIESLPKSNTQYSELLLNPTVKLEGKIAMIWSKYEFKIDGKHSHFGTELFSFIKVNEKWKINSSTYTVDINK